VHIKPSFSLGMTHSNALQQVVCSILNVLTPETVKAENKRNGQRRRCNNALVTGREMDVIEQALPAMAEIFRTIGGVKEAQMDAAGIPSVNDESTNSKPKDEQALQKIRSVIMSSEDCVRQYRAHVKRREAEPACSALALEQRKVARNVRDRKADEVKARARCRIEERHTV
jgi:hypothetical protein